MNKQRAALIPRPGTGAVSFYWKRWSLRPQRPSAPSLRRFISGSFLTSAEPAPLLRLRPLRPPLPFLRRRGASNLPAGDRQSGSRCAPFLRRLSLPCGQPASASHRLPVRAAAHAPSLRRFSFPSVSAELISGRFPSSPLRASNPSGDRGERYARPARHGSVPPPSTSRIQPPQAPAEPAAFRLRLCAGLSRPSLSFAPAPSSARSRSAWVPTLRRLRISPLAPLCPGRPSSPPLPAAPLPSREPACVTHRLRRLRRSSTPADSLSVRSASAVARRACRASGCSVPLRGTASAGSGRTPFVLTPPLRPAQAQARFGSASRQPARSLPPAAGVPQTPQPASVVRSLGRLPSGSIPATLHSGQPASAPPFLRFRRCPCDRRPQGLLLSAPGGLRFCRLPSSALCTREFCRSGLRRRQAQAPLASAKPSQAQDWHARCAAAVAPGSGLRFDLAGSISIASVTFVPKALPFRRSSSVPSDPLHWALPGALYCASLIRLRPSRFRRLHRNDLRLDCFPPTRPFFPFTPLHSAAPPCAGALQRPVSAWGAGASPLHSAPLRERTVTPYPFISLRTLSAPLPSVYLPGLRSVRFTSVRASAHVIRYDIYAMVATTLLFCMR